MVNKFWLNAISVNANSKNVDKNYYQSDEEFTTAKNETLNSPAIFGENIVIKVADKNASNRDLQARDILAKYISGVSGFNNILGSAMEDAFIKANLDDFTENGILERDGEEFRNYLFNSSKSDGNVSMPTLQKLENGDEVYIIGTEMFDKYGNIYKQE